MEVLDDADNGDSPDSPDDETSPDDEYSPDDGDSSDSSDVEETYYGENLAKANDTDSADEMQDSSDTPGDGYSPEQH
jgi:hypothetical protein